MSRRPPIKPPTKPNAGMVLLERELAELARTDPAMTPAEQWARLLALASETKRGCTCEYDHRCGNCETIVRLHTAVGMVRLLADVEAVRLAASEPTAENVERVARYLCDFRVADELRTMPSWSTLNDRERDRKSVV